MKYLFLCYPSCSTCRKAQKYLEEHGIDFELRHIANSNPNFEELKHWLKLSKLPVDKFFNTSGTSYRNLGLKNKLKSMADIEKLQLLATDGLLVKRPLLIGEDLVLVGFKEDAWSITHKMEYAHK